MSRVIIFLFLMVYIGITNGCFEEEVDSSVIIENISKRNFKQFENVFIESERYKDGKKVVWKFIKEYEGKRYVIPNFQLYSEEEVMDSSLFDVSKYASLNGITNSEESLLFVKKFSDSIIKDYLQLKLYKVFSSHNQGEFISFYPTKSSIIIYCEDLKTITSKYWLEVLNNSRRYNESWYVAQLSDE